MTETWIRKLAPSCAWKSWCCQCVRTNRAATHLAFTQKCNGSRSQLVGKVLLTASMGHLGFASDALRNWISYPSSKLQWCRLQSECCLDWYGHRAPFYHRRHWTRLLFRDESVAACCVSLARSQVQNSSPNCLKELLASLIYHLCRLHLMFLIATPRRRPFCHMISEWRSHLHARSLATVHMLTTIG